MLLTATPRNRRRVSRRHAFTLIEVLVVMAILVILRRGRERRAVP